MDTPAVPLESRTNGKRWLWRICKVVVTGIIVFAVGRQFAIDLAKLDWATLELRPGWLLLAALIYLCGLGFSGLFWYRLLWRFGERPNFWPACRAYYVGHLGKYVPGKAVALLLRASLIRGPNVRLGVAIVSAFYEVLTTMAAGALLAAIVFTIQPPQLAGLTWHPVYTGVLLLGFAGIPVMPGVFNFVVGRLAERFQLLESFRLPHITLLTLLEGMLFATCGWLLLGLSTWCVFNAVAGEVVYLTWSTGPQFLATVCLAYVAGFLALIVPGGLGVREEIMRQFFPPVLSLDLTVLAIVLLRLLWTGTEIIVAGMLYVKGGRIPKNPAND